MYGECEQASSDRGNEFPTTDDMLVHRQMPHYKRQEFGSRRVNLKHRIDIVEYITGIAEYISRTPFRYRKLLTGPPGKLRLTGMEVGSPEVAR